MIKQIILSMIKQIIINPSMIKQIIMNISIIKQIIMNSVDADKTVSQSSKNCVRTQLPL